MRHIGLLGCLRSALPFLAVLLLAPNPAQAQCSPNSAPGYQAPSGCECKAQWSYQGQTICNGRCANPDNDSNGPWCFTTSRCGGYNYDYCQRPSGTAECTPEVAEDFAPPPESGCRCKKQWSFGAQTICGGSCANPDDDDNGPWCMTEGSCGGYNWIYCHPRSGCGPGECPPPYGFIPADSDGDGIDDSVDVQLRRPSGIFADPRAGGSARGELIASAGGRATITQTGSREPWLRVSDHSDGEGGTALALCDLDGLQASLWAGTQLRLRCGAATVDVEAGGLEIPLAGGVRLEIPAGATVVIEPAQDSQLRFTNHAGKAPAILLHTEGGTRSLRPGESVLLDGPG